MKLIINFDKSLYIDTKEEVATANLSQKARQVGDDHVYVKHVIKQPGDLSFEQWKARYKTELTNIMADLQLFLSSLSSNDKMIAPYIPDRLEKHILKTIFKTSHNSRKNYPYLK